MPVIMNNTMGSAAASLSFSQTHNSGYQREMSDHQGLKSNNSMILYSTMSPAAHASQVYLSNLHPFIMSNQDMVIGPKPVASFSNEYLKPLNTEISNGNNLEDRMVEQLINIYWKIEVDEIIQTMKESTVSKDYIADRVREIIQEHLQGQNPSDMVMDPRDMREIMD